MFQIEAPNIGFEHLAKSSKGYWGQRSPKIIQGHLGSLSVKNKIMAMPHILWFKHILFQLEHQNSIKS